MGDFSVGFVIFVFFFGLLLGVLYIWGLLVVLASLLCTKLGFFLVCLLLGASFGRCRLGHYLLTPWENAVQLIKVLVYFL